MLIWRASSYPGGIKRLRSAQAAATMRIARSARTQCGSHPQSHRDTPGSQRLHHPFCQQAVSDSPQRYPCRAARRDGPRREAPGWHAGGALSRTLSDRSRMCAAAQNRDASQAGPTTPQSSSQTQRSSTGSAQQYSAFRWLAGMEGGTDQPNPYTIKFQSERRATTARRSSRLLYPKTAAQKLHPNRFVLKNQNPRNGLLSCAGPVDRGFGAICFGASPVAAAFGSAPGSAISPEHRIQLTLTPQPVPSKADISTWHKIGHFYLALTLVLLGTSESSGRKISALIHLLQLALNLSVSKDECVPGREKPASVTSPSRREFPL
jgi:hypothetical protein